MRCSGLSLRLQFEVRGWNLERVFWTVSGGALWSFSVRTIALGAYESVSRGVELVPAAGCMVEEVRVSVTRVNQLLNLLRTG